MALESRPVEYTVPADQHIENFALKICASLGEEYCKPNIVRDLAGFLKILVRIRVKQANSRNNVDK